MVLACGEAVDYDQLHSFHSMSFMTLRIFIFLYICFLFLTKSSFTQPCRQMVGCKNLVVGW